MSTVQELELIKRMASFHARPVEDGHTLGLVSSLFQTLGARSEIAQQLLKSNPSTNNERELTELLKYHNDLLKHLLSIP